MAVQGLSSAIGDAILALIEWAWPRVTSRVDELLEEIADYVRPQPPMTVRSLSGEVLTGVLVVDRGQALLFIGTRDMPASQGPPTRDGRYYQDEVGPLWPHDVQPRR